MRRKGISFAVLTAIASSLVVAASAQATFHENLIREVHEGGVSGDYVELQAYAAGQNLVAGKHVVSYDAGGGPAPLTDFTIPSNVGNGANQATILIANTATVGGVTPDFNAGVNLNVDNTGGTVCFTDSSITAKLDCVAFDGTGGANVTVPAGGNFGAPFALPGANLDGQSLIRTLSRGCATALDPADDTNSAADFTLGAGSPRNNSATPTETVCPPGNPTSPTNPAGHLRKRKCKKSNRSASAAKKKKCKKKKH